VRSSKIELPYLDLTTHSCYMVCSMDKFAPDSSVRPCDGTPGQARFTTQAATVEDLLKAHTVGLVNLDDYRKRRAEAMDLKERASSAALSSGASTLLDE
jgi:protein FAM50